ncbi:helix-turn-helix domain-containing protein [Pseudomonas sp. NPDC090592]|uniref:helix-turn-helix domain-containing protein n=1 Tax=Pseudomonas sp. NPDC090592 TaxID=3364480 RepID=UPI00383BB67D
MSLKSGFATVLKAIRLSRGLTHKNMAGASSRGYMLKLEHGLSSPTVDKMIAISESMGVSPLTLFTLTLSLDSDQPVDALVQRLKADVADLETKGVLKSLGVSSLPDVRATSPATSRRHKVASSASQAELCFAE